MPNISNKLQKQIATDEMPQSAEGKTVMTTQPKFIPANAVKVQFKKIYPPFLSLFLITKTSFLLTKCEFHL